MSRILASPLLGPALGALSLAAAVVALVVTLTHGDPDLSHRIVYVSKPGTDDRANLPSVPWPRISAYARGQADTATQSTA